MITEPWVTPGLTWCRIFADYVVKDERPHFSPPLPPLLLPGPACCGWMSLGPRPQPGGPPVLLPVWPQSSAPALSPVHGHELQHPLHCPLPVRQGRRHRPRLHQQQWRLPDSRQFLQRAEDQQPADQQCKIIKNFRQCFPWTGRHLTGPQPGR